MARKKKGLAALAAVLGCDEKKAGRLLKEVELDGDERASLAAEFGLDHDGPGGIGQHELERGLAKLRTAL